MPTEQELKNARTVFDTLCEYLDENTWKYEKDEDKLSVTLLTKGDDLVIPIWIKINTDLQIISVYSNMPFEVPEDMRIPMTVAVTAANYSIVDGSFDYSVKSGTILYRITSSYRGSVVGKEALEYLLFCACVTADNYNDKFKDFIDRKVSTKEMLEIIYKED